MPQASRSIVVNVRPEQLLAVISDYERYPEFLPEVKSISVAHRTADSVDVTYEVELIKRIRYTIRIATRPDGVKWSLVSGDLFKQNAGGWVLRPEGDGATHATYTLEVAIGGFIPVPKAVTDKLTESSLPGVLAHFKERAEKLYPKS